MKTYYTLLGIETGASLEEIEAAYRRERERYSVEHLAEMDADIRKIAEQRTAELDHAYAVLSDSQQRQEYDASIGVAGDDAPRKADNGTASKRASQGLSKREWGFLAGGVLVALVVIGLVWAWTGQTADNGPAVGIVDRPTPDVALPTLDGEEMRLSDYRGSVVLVNFWGTWCEPCRRETPALQAAYEQLRDEGLVVVGVNITEDELIQGKTEEDIRAFAETYGVSYPIALDMEGEMMRAFRVYPLPTSFFIDTEGTVRFMRVGEINTEEIHDLFARLQPAARSQ